MSDSENLPATPEAAAPEVIEEREGMFGVQGTGDTSGFGGLKRSVVLPGATPKPYGSWFDGACWRTRRTLTGRPSETNRSS